MFEHHPLRFLTLALVVLLLLVAAYLGVFRLQYGSPVHAEWWVKPAYQYKQSLAQEMQGPKLIVLSGSNALFGLDSALLKKKVGMNVVNLSVHAGLDMEFYHQQLDDVLGEGDVVVMPLEYEYYVSNPVSSEWFVSNMIAWGHDVYLNRIDTWAYLEFVTRVPLKRLWTGFLTRNYPGKEIPFAQAKAEVKKANASGKVKFTGYTHRSMNLNGDFLVSSRPPQSGIKRVRDIVKKDGDAYLTVPGKLSPRFVEYFNKIRALADERGARVMLTWPVSVKNKLFDMAKQETHERIGKLQTALEGIDARIECDPTLFNMHYAFFYDNRYHLNAKGSLLRTVNLGDCARQFISNELPQSYNTAKSLEKRRFQEMKLLQAK